MRNDETEKEKDKKKKPYEKPALTTEELFEATVVACAKTLEVNCMVNRS
jgi:hypothetical protein